MKDNVLIIDGQIINLSEETARELKSKLCKKKRSFKPESFVGGWGIAVDGYIVEIAHGCWENEYEMGNWRATKAGVEREVAYRKAVQRVRAWKDENCEAISLNIPICTVYWERSKNYFFIRWHSDFLTGTPIGYFTSEPDAQNCIAHCTDDLKLILTEGWK